MSQFTEIVDEILGRLLHSRGFVRVAQEHDLVMYESTACSIAVGYDSQRSNEVFLGLNRRTHLRGPDFGFDEVIRAATVPAGSYPSGYAARDETSIRHLLQKMANLLETYCVPLLQGDDAAWLRLVTQRDDDAACYATENSLRIALNSATEAWHAKDFAKVVGLLGPVRQLLGTTDRAKLEYAERRCAGLDCPDQIR